MEKTVNGTTTHYLWDGDQVLKEYNANGTVKANYFLGLGREAISTGGQWYLYLNDTHGSVTGLLDTAGNRVASYTFGDWGETLTEQGTVYNPYRWNGEQLDAESGLVYLRNRYYQPSTGRFMQRDPIGYEGGLNLYAYCGGDPINSVDPSGLEPEALVKYVSQKFGPYVVRGGFGANAGTRMAPRLLMNLGTKAGPTGLIVVAGGGAGFYFVRAAMQNSREIVRRMNEFREDPVGPFRDKEEIDPFSAESLQLETEQHQGSQQTGSGPRPYVVQSAGHHTIRQSTSDALNRHFGTNYARREWGRINESLKEDRGLAPNYHNADIWSDGRVVDSHTGKTYYSERLYALNESPYSTPYDDQCPNSERTVAKFFIYTEEIRPEELSKLLGLTPTRTASKGQKPRIDRSPSPLSLWLLSSEDHVQSLDLRRHLDWLLDLLLPKSRELLSLQSKPNLKMRIECIWWARLGGGPTLWPKQMEIMASLNLECCFDLMFFGEGE